MLARRLVVLAAAAGVCAVARAQDGLEPAQERTRVRTIGAARALSGETGTPETVAAVTTTGAGRAPGGAPALVGASYRDANGSRALDEGDVLVLRFAKPVRLSSFDPARDLALAPGDDLGAGATAAQGSARNDEVLVTLGRGARISVFGTYAPGEPPGPGKSPASVGLAASRRRDALTDLAGRPAEQAPAAHVDAEDGSRLVYQGRSHAGPPVAQARAYFGNLHAHTGFSDGKSDPAGAFAHARTKGRLDFMCVTDHLEQIWPREWDATQRMADAADEPGKFVALVGFEWANGWASPLKLYNHLNVIGTQHRIRVLKTIELAGFYRETFERCFPDGAIGKFNHVYLSKPPLRYSQWDDFAYDARADLFMKLIRVEGNGSKQTKELGYLPALEKGWHLAPTASQDNHQANWGDKNDRRTGVWASDLTRAEVLRSLREGRAFATDDRNATIRLVADDAVWMGSTIARPGPVRLAVEVADPDASEGFARVEIVGRNGAVVASRDLGGASSGRFELVVDPTCDAYFWAHAVQVDGDELFSAPIYVDR